MGWLHPLTNSQQNIGKAPFYWIGSGENDEVRNGSSKAGIALPFERCTYDLFTAGAREKKVEKLYNPV